MATSDSGETVVTGTDQADDLSLSWQQETLPLAALDKLELPRVVRLQHDNSECNMGPLVNLENPLLVYSKRRRTKVYAECLQWNARRTRFEPHGDVLEIPKDYSGWFEILGMKDAQVKERKAYTSIKEVADSGCDHFLLRTQAAGFSLPEANDITELGDEVLVYPGEILRTRGIETRKWKLDESRKATGSAQTKFLRCHDYRDNNILLPFAHPGDYRSIVDGKITAINSNQKQDKVKDESCVYQMEDILQRHSNFPLVVRLVFGWPPRLPPGQFHGVFRLLGIRRPDTFVVHPLIPGDNVLMEIPMDIAWQVNLATQSRDQMKNNAIWRANLRMCFQKVFPFVTSIKAINSKYKRNMQEAQPASEENIKEGEKNKKSKKTKSEVIVRQKEVKSRKNKFSLLRPKSVPDTAPPGEGEKKPRDHSMLTPPVDMAGFNAMEIYPPLPQWRLADSWTISFQDPSTLWEESSNDITGCENEAGGGASLLRRERKGQRVKRSESVMLTMGHLPEADENDVILSDDDVISSGSDVTASDNRKPDLRQMRGQRVVKREAIC